ncbi:AbrB/MazE/SpoVT family DNA-binding domain-containing protein [Candidatus Micrarchaeota archaeon]|nr:AbrB/MazE/SpoVT family DNA-binding domain-containing protein [Candidatus Micrarchaeota archaeon]
MSNFVTRHGQITLPKEVREMLDIHEGDQVIINVVGTTVTISKKDPTIWDKIGSFLPENFEKILREIRGDTTKRFKRLGIIE